VQRGREIEIPYGHKRLRFEVDASRLLKVIAPVQAGPSLNPSKEIEMSIENPINAPRIEDMVNKGKKIAIACDDNTRATPVHLILPVLLKKIENLRVRRENIRVIIALGTHRRMTEDQMKEKYGAEAVEKYTFINHDYYEQSELKYVGMLTNKASVWINKHFLECDVKIGIGNIVPHFSAGWSGGSKILLPGLAGDETVGQMHLLSAVTVPNSLGKTENPSRILMDEFAKKTGLHLIINTVLTQNKEIVKVFSGDFIKAHRNGIKDSRRVYGVSVPFLADITVASSYPADIDFWQAQKGLYSANLATKKGGGIILVASCPEGVSTTHPQWIEFLQYKTEEIKLLIEQKKVEDIVAASLAFHISKIRQLYDVCIVTEGISYNEAEKLHFTKFGSIPEALDYFTRKYGPKSKIITLTHGGVIFPISYRKQRS